MGQLLLFIVVALVVATIVFGVTVLLSGGDPGLTPVEPDGRSVPLPGDRPLGEGDIAKARFDTVWRGYRMNQVDQALHRAAYDIGYKGELISVLEAEVAALREGRTEDAEVLRRAREAAVAPGVTPGEPAGADEVEPAGAPENPEKPVEPVADDPVAETVGLPAPGPAPVLGKAPGSDEEPAGR
ncbi:DivIVA domain-containing protein [Actinoplanes rectilineatus]|uniref:DivIVA domain-containing protein n=1 Tax=Actinoplanes rectilineatus TaxID=113571 RepID=UPI0005F29C86|nr:DivIVA domain-containing protein [Actinoplanes rectilineatus]